MNDAEIEAMAAQLEAAAPVEDAKFLLEEVWSGDAIADHIIANRAGFLHLASLLLRGALLEEGAVSPPLIELENEQAEAFFDKVERREVWLPPQPIPPGSRWLTWSDKLSCCGLILLASIFTIVFCLGIYAILHLIRW